MNHGRLFSNKVGYMQFCRVMAAAQVLEERSSDVPCFADLREANIPHRFPLGWLKYLFGEELPLDPPSLWNVYEFLKTEGRYDKSSDSWDAILIRNASSNLDWMNILAVRTVEQGTERVLAELKEQETQTEERGIGDSESAAEAYAELLSHVKALVQILGTNDEQLHCIMSYLTEPDKERLLTMVFEENTPNALRELPFMMLFLPRQIIVKAIAELYCRDFWELWSGVKTGYAYHLCQKIAAQEGTPIRPIPTEIYLHIAPDDKLFCLAPNEMETLTSETRSWMDELRNRFKDLCTQKPFADCLTFQRSMMETLADAENQHAGVLAFRCMFYEFMSNWAQPEYQAMWLLFKAMATDSEAPTIRLRQYLAMLANPPLRKEVFGI